MKHMYCCGAQLMNLETEENQYMGFGEFWCDKCGTTYRTEVYSIYSPEYNITFIMEGLSICYDVDEGDMVYEEQIELDSKVVGCYKGKPINENTNKYFGNLNIGHFISKEDVEMNRDLPEEIKEKIEKYISGNNLPDYKKTMCEVVNK